LSLIQQRGNKTAKISKTKPFRAILWGASLRASKTG
jgi:hypothetical protein